MKKIKNFLVILLSLIMIMGAVAACGGNNTSEETQVTDSKDGLTGQINVYTRDSASGTRDGFESVVDFKDELTETASEVAGNGEMATSVGQDPNAIGYVSLTTDFAANSIKALAYEGVEPSVENVISGDYTLTRPFDFTTRAAGDYAMQEEEDLVKAFIVFITESEEGLLAVESAGGIVDMTNAKPWEELKADHPIVDQDNSAITLKTGGSSSVEKTIRTALEAFQPLAGNVQFEMDHTGSGDGWKRVLGDEKDGPTAASIGFASRNFKAEEDVSKAIAYGTYCLDAIVTVVETNNPIDNLTNQQIYDIFTGAIRNWEDLAVKQ